MYHNKSNFLDELRNEWVSLTKAQKWLYFLYTLLLVGYILPFFRAIETRIGLYGLAHLSDTFFIILSVIGCISIFRKKIRLRDILFLIALIVFHHLSATTHVGTALYAARNTTRFIILCLPMFLVGLTIDTKTSPKLFVGMSYIALFLQIVYLYVFGVTINEAEGIGEAMTDAYNLLPFVCFLVWNAFQRGGFWHIAIAILSAFILFSLGTRGPLICLVFFIAVYLIFFKKFKYDTVSKLFIGSIALIIYVFSFEISIILSGFSSQLGLSSRVFDSIIENKMTDMKESNGRNQLWDDVIRTLNDNKIFFDFNLYADRLYSGLDSYMSIDRTRDSNETISYNSSIYDENEVGVKDYGKMNPKIYRFGKYVHNLELELLCEFGLIGGIIVISLLYFFIRKAFLLTWENENVILLLVFFTASIMQLQFSNSYLMAPIFWFFIGMCVAFIRSNKKKEKLPLGYRLHLLKQEIKDAKNRRA